MKPFEEHYEVQSKNWEYAMEHVEPKEDLMPDTTIKGSQFKQPLLEFSGACAGCGETPYAKLVTQLFGDRMIIANATGCSSIWGLVHHQHHIVQIKMVEDQLGLIPI